ncbi:MAG: substrate-binding domain-containing protein [Ruminococcus sp.]|nr:substrate-binding domain-containing protein [Ruminococcus sp.]
MNLGKTLSRMIAVSASAALMLGTAGCGKNSSGSARNITVICLSDSSEYSEDLKKGAADGGEEMLCNITFAVPDDPSPEAQAALIKEAVEKKTGAIIIAPSDRDQLNDELKAAEDAGIPVVAVGSEVSYGGISTVVGPQNGSAGAIAGRRAEEVVPEGGRFAVIGSTESDTECQERAAGFIRYLESSTKASFKFSASKYCEGDADKAKELALELIDQEPDLTLILGASEGAAGGICRAVKEKGLTSKISVIGFGISDEEIGFVKDGILAGVMVQSPYNIGYLGVRNCMKLLSGQAVPQFIDTGFNYVDKDNIGEDYIQLLLDPAGQGGAEK